MEQFIRYLYEYENGKPVRNVGFAKVRKYDGKCTVQIYGKGLDFGTEKKLEVLVFWVKDEKCIGISQGEMEGAAPVINYLLKFQAEDVGNAEIFRQINGIILENDRGRRYAAVWDNMPVNIDNMRRDGEDIIETPSQDAGMGEERTGIEMEEPQEELVKETIPESLVEHVERLVEEQQVKENSVKEEAEEIERYHTPKSCTCEKIRRQDIARLPRKDWGLANNSFLLHGFYNYHHLLYIKEGDVCWLGVPGIYHEREQRAAETFGFPMFKRLIDMDVELSESERNPYDDFGYWCRQVEQRKV